MSRALLVLPGRGAYTRASLGSLPSSDPRVARADALRRERGLLPLSELDGADRLEPGIHLAPANASPLIWLASLLDAERAVAEHDIVAVVGNSLGWYTALTVAGVLSFEDAYRLVQEMGLLQQHPAPEDRVGGQVVYPLTDAQWRPRGELIDAVARAVERNGDVFASVELGGYAVLAGTDAGLERLTAALPAVQIGERRYPMRLALHGPYHTPLMAHIAEEAVRTLGDLEARMPELPLIDGRGQRHSPWSADPDALLTYTLGEQLITPYRFATGLHVALREYAPDVLILTGPGATLMGVCGQVVVAEGYRGIRSRAALEAVQMEETPMIVQLGSGRGDAQGRGPEERPPTEPTESGPGRGD